MNGSPEYIFNGYLSYFFPGFSRGGGGGRGGPGGKFGGGGG